MTVLTESEQVFVRRMAPHVEAGKTLEEAAQAVLDDDARLFAAIQEGKQYWFGDGPGAITSRGAPEAQTLRQTLTQHVYNKLREGA